VIQNIPRFNPCLIKAPRARLCLAPELPLFVSQVSLIAEAILQPPITRLHTLISSFNFVVVKFSVSTQYLNMSTLEDLEDLEREEREKKDEKKDGDKKEGGDDTEMKDAEKEEEEEEGILDDEILSLNTREINVRKRLLENELRIMKSEFQRLTHEKASMNEKIKDNVDKIDNNRYVH
jgi:mannitol-specific phosphotransferase system IIBC component